IASLNRPAEYRLRQIAANLERHRWLPRNRGDRFVVVNIPAFQLRAYDAGVEALSMNVVVGAEYGGRSTPVFSDSMAYVIFRPYWNVPASIASRELWPKQRNDPGYFRRNGYESVHASWGTYVRQKPAPNNALGQAKFIFPNDHAIYLHDTPAHSLFDEQVRAFSHGCIRVAHPDQLAAFVLGVQGWNLDQARAAMATGPDNHRVNLERKLPVYIVYFTTYMRDGVLHFGNDIYDRDDALVQALGSVALPTDADKRGAEQLRTFARTLQ
ncbi:MAG: L,D-transpeptidase family protein, partial [Gemmatimonadaceae bacterium]